MSQMMWFKACHRFRHPNAIPSPFTLNPPYQGPHRGRDKRNSEYRKEEFEGLDLGRCFVFRFGGKPSSQGSHLPSILSSAFNSSRQAACALSPTHAWAKLLTGSTPRTQGTRREPQTVTIRSAHIHNSPKPARPWPSAWARTRTHACGGVRKGPPGIPSESVQHARYFSLSHATLKPLPTLQTLSYSHESMKSGKHPVHLWNKLHSKQPLAADRNQTPHQ